MSKLKSKLAEIFRPKILQLNYDFNRYKDVVWIIGSGRSGSTWVADMLNYKRSYRELLEPFRPKLIEEAKFLRLHEYVRPNEENQQLNTYCESVFSGKFLHKDADSAANKLLYKGLLVKDVFANLLAYNVYKRNPQIKMLLLLRHPFMVAQSKLKKKNWIWVTEPIEFLEQKKLVDDYLYPFLDIIKMISMRGDYIEKQILNWCIINYVPLKQFAASELNVIFYEEMVRNTETEVANTWAFIEGKDKTKKIAIPEKVKKTPSSVSTDISGKVDTTTINANWQKGFTEEQLYNGQTILERFGFGELYFENGLPNPDGLKAFLKA